MMNIKKIITHGGIFHADDVVSVALLQLVAGEVEVERKFTVTQEELDDPSIWVVDIGKMYDQGRSVYDHHQNNDPVCALELVLRNPDIMYSLFGEDGIYPSTNPEYSLETFVKRVAKPLSMWDTGRVTGSVGTLHFSQALTSFNEGPNQEENFHSVLLWVYPWLRRELQSAAAAATNRAKLLKCKVVHPVGREDNSPEPKGVLVLPEFIPLWQKYVPEHENWADIRFAISPNLRGGWVVSAGPDKEYLPEEWRGLDQDALAKATGVADAVFVHQAGFIGGAGSKEGAMALAKAAILWDAGQVSK